MGDEEGLDTLYFKRNGKLYKVATDDLISSEDNYSQYTLPLEREFTPLNSSRYPGSPLSIPFSEETDNTPRSVIVMSLPLGMRLSFTGEGGTRIKDFLR